MQGGGRSYNGTFGASGILKIIDDLILGRYAGFVVLIDSSCGGAYGGSLG
jgi:hypothetical protein